MTSDCILLNEKYENINKIIIEMLSRLLSKRPDCKRLINIKHLWSLDINQIEKDSIFKKLNELTISENTTETNFINYFLKMKSISE
jgi:hypothetical protein